jgi:hypothetical protein
MLLFVIFPFFRIVPFTPSNQFGAAAPTLGETGSAPCNKVVTNGRRSRESGTCEHSIEHRRPLAGSATASAKEMRMPSVV